MAEETMFLRLAIDESMPHRSTKQDLLHLLEQTLEIQERNTVHLNALKDGALVKKIVVYTNRIMSIFFVGPACIDHLGGCTQAVPGPFPDVCHTS